MPKKKLENFIEKLIDFNHVSVGFKAEFRDRKNKKAYIVAEEGNRYLLKLKIRNRSFDLSLKSLEELKAQDNLSEKDKEIFLKLFGQLKNNQIDKVSISGLRSRNPILTASIRQSIKCDKKGSIC